MPVFFRTVGTLGGPSFFLERGGRSLRRVSLSLTVAVIERADGICLVDTGWSRAQCAFPEESPGALHAALLGMRVRPEDAIASQLISCGLDPSDVRHVVATHTHRDHIDGAEDFPSAELHVSQAELDARVPGRSKVPGRSSRLRAHRIEGPAALGFARSHDLFGDGSVLLLASPGHTLGSTTVAVALDEGWLLHVGDAAMFVRDYRDDDALPPSPYMRVMSADLACQRGTYRSIVTAEREHGARVVTSHDQGRFDALPHTSEDAWLMRGERRRGKRKR